MANFAKDLKDMPEEELHSNINNHSPMYGQLSLNELIRRAIKDLNESIDKFNESSDKYSRKIFRLTWALVILTIVLAIPLLVDLIKFIFSS
jgi:hypothetical protein